jgi:hypothetical protein
VLLTWVSQAAGLVLRGGSFNNNQNNAAASYRNNNNPNNRNNNNGFRVVFAAHDLLTLHVVSVALAAGNGSQPHHRLWLPKVAGVYGFQLEAKAEG